MESSFNINDVELSAQLAQMSQIAGDTLPLARSLAGLMKAEVQENFEQQGRPAWTPLRPSTIAQRKREGTWPGKMLNRHGSTGLWGSISTRATAEQAIVGVNRPYARILNFGGVIHRVARSILRKQNRGEKNRFAKGFQKEAHGHTMPAHDVRIPARPFMVISRGGLDLMLDKVKKWMSLRGGDV